MVFFSTEVNKLDYLGIKVLLKTDTKMFVIFKKNHVNETIMK